MGLTPLTQALGRKSRKPAAVLKRKRESEKNDAQARHELALVLVSDVLAGIINNITITITALL
jgi:hypothetical protein